jgi:hypothetical protein
MRIATIIATLPDARDLAAPGQQHPFVIDAFPDHPEMKQQDWHARKVTRLKSKNPSRGTGVGWWR